MNRAEIIGRAHGNDLILTTIKTVEEAARMAQVWYPECPTAECAAQIFKNAQSEKFAGWRKFGKSLKFFGRQTLYGPLLPLF